MGKKKDEKGSSRTGVSRRGFLQLMGAGAIASAASPGLGGESAAAVIEPAEMTKIKLLDQRSQLTVFWLSPDGRSFLFSVRNLASLERRLAARGVNAALAPF